ncbi:MAG TPA: class I SAM-dependent methyltransferase [Cyclobacteriaceae bacterium]|nr:class I SAM-dependent methyltransferase [Cyclobacteriaceae bacterium]
MIKEADLEHFGFIERSACPACKGKELSALYELPAGSAIISKYLHNFYKEQGGIDFSLLEAWPYRLSECKSCTLVFQKVILNDYAMEVLYERWINPAITFEESKKHDLQYYLNLIEEIKQAIDFLGKKPYELNIMDFGMGWSEWCKAGSALGCNVTGAELSAARIQNALKHNIRVVNVNDSLKPEFDFINTEQVFEHIPEPLETLQKLVAIVKPGGIIKISIPDCVRLHELLKLNDWDAPKGTENSLNIVAPLEHINSFTFTSLNKMASATGLKLLPSLAYRKYPLSIIDVFKNTYRHFYIKNIRKNKGTYLFFQRPV